MNHASAPALATTDDSERMVVIKYSTANDVARFGERHAGVKRAPALMNPHFTVFETGYCTYCSCFVVAAAFQWDLSQYSLNSTTRVTTIIVAES